jgi:general secretion pathway protein A
LSSEEALDARSTSAPFLPHEPAPPPATSAAAAGVGVRIAAGSMYNDFYGFREPPFNITPDPRFLFFSDKHREAFNHVLFGIRERKGFIQITGEVGAGKTTVCRAILAELGPTYKTALILNPMLTGTQLMRTVLTELGLRPRKLDRTAYLDILNHFLLEQAATGNDVVLLIDEAQDLEPELLEQVRLLSNLETDQRKLLQIVLIGQPELREKLNEKGLRQLRQRITVRYHLRPLDRFETARYVAHRLRVAGADGRPTFTPWAMRSVHRYSHGIPRLVNAVCDKALLYGYVNGTYELTGRAVKQAVRELEGEVA